MSEGAGDELASVALLRRVWTTCTSDPAVIALVSLPRTCSPSTLELPLLTDDWSPSAILRFLAAASRAASSTLPIPPPPPRRLPPTRRGSATPLSDSAPGVPGREDGLSPGRTMKLTESSYELVDRNRSAILSSGRPSPSAWLVRACSSTARDDRDGDGPYLDEPFLPTDGDPPYERELGSAGGGVGDELDPASAGVPLFFLVNRPMTTVARRMDAGTGKLGGRGQRQEERQPGERPTAQTRSGQGRSGEGSCRR